MALGNENLIEILFADKGDKYLYVISLIYIDDGWVTVVVKILVPCSMMYLPEESVKYTVAAWLIYYFIIDTPHTFTVKLLAG